jgi:hypothetical protein
MAIVDHDECNTKLYENNPCNKNQLDYCEDSIERVDVRKDVVVVDHNPEMADYTNPTGAIYRPTFEVLAMTHEGRRFAHRHFFGLDRDAADRLAIRVLHRGEIDHAYWVETYPEYGSSAWAVEEVYRQADLATALSRGDMEAVDRLA